MVVIRFDKGTLLLDGTKEELKSVISSLHFDDRVELWRAKALDYATIIMTLYREKVEFDDLAKEFVLLDLQREESFPPRPHQAEAFTKWTDGGGRGVVVMPTGSGKSYLARMAIEKIHRNTLIVVPTIDLMLQWNTQLERCFNQEIGMLGGGSKEILPITVSTYDSAVLQMEYIGTKFGLLIFDECHHLAGPTNKHAALFSIAPYRLGLTATPERENEYLLYELIGPKVSHTHIDELEGDVLAPYTIHRIDIQLDEDETQEYEASRNCYIDFVKECGIDFRNRGAWGTFIVRCFTVDGGREAFQAYQRQKRIARTSRNKLKQLWHILKDHPGERILIFTADNETAYTLGRTFFLPVITHATKAKERKNMLDNFRSGAYEVLVTSKVLNEGIDVPEATVGIILSGSGSTREHVQRLGRILRPTEGKEATLYELVSEGTSEAYTSNRRRNHRAYERFN